MPNNPPDSPRSSRAWVSKVGPDLDLPTKTHYEVSEDSVEEAYDLDPFDWDDDES